jgi:hypothetical protein
MSEHLSEREISAWAMGGREGASVAHVRECPSCRAAAEGLEGTLSDFRMAVREHSEAAILATPVAAAFAPSRSPLWPSLAVAGVALAAILVAIVPEFPRSASVAPADPAADAALMRQVDADVSQAVPDSMEPLLQLFAVENVPGKESKTLER